MARTRATLLDHCYQVALWLAFQGLRFYWFARRPRDHGPLVVIWFENRVLLVRHSYKAHRSAPVGAMRKAETAVMR